METTLAYSGGRLVILNERLTQFTDSGSKYDTPLAAIREASVTQRSLFRHPRIGLIFAVVLIIPSAWYAVTRLPRAPVALLIRGLGLASLFGFAFGVWGLYDVLTSPREFTLRLLTSAGARELYLPGVNPAELERFVDGLPH